MTRVENTKERLDKVVVNTSWRDIFQGNSITHLFSHTSDHRPILLHARTDLRCCGRSTRSFKFEKDWLMRDDCEKVINEAWGFMGNMELGLRSVREKISRRGSDLEAQGATNTHPDEKEIKKVQKRVEDLSMAEPTMENKSEFLAASRILDDLLLK